MAILAQKTGGGSHCFLSMLMQRFSHKFSTSSLQCITPAFLLYFNFVFSVKISWYAFTKSKFGSCSCSDILLTLVKTSAKNVKAEGLHSPTDQVMKGPRKFGLPYKFHCIQMQAPSVKLIKNGWKKLIG